MEYVYAAMLLYKAGKDVTEDAVSAVLKAAGVDVDAAKAKALVAALDGVDMEEAINTAAVAAAPVAAAPAADAAPAAEEKKEEKKEEPKEEEAAAGLGALFG